MIASYFDFLDYWRNSLADGGRMCPSDSLIAAGIRLPRQQLDSGRLTASMTKDLFSKGRDSSEDAGNVLPVLILPLVLARSRQHGVEKRTDSTYLAPIVISAGLSRGGEIVRDPDAKPPVFARDLLEPTSRERALGTVDAADRFYAGNIRELTKWQDTIAFAAALFESVTGNSIDTFEMSGWQREEGARILPVGDSPEAVHLLRLYDWLRKRKESPLLRKFLTDIEERASMDFQEQWRQSQYQTGHYNPKDPLAPSQRIALIHLLKDFHQEEQITVVNGPPGTGKTRLIQNVVASIWVNAALHEAPCPVVVAVSTSNQAVTNVNHAFDQIESNDSDPLSGRWLSKVKSFGMFMPSARASRANSENGSKILQLYEQMPTRSEPSRHFASEYETADGLTAGVQEFLAKFAEANFPGPKEFTLSTAKKSLLDELKKCAEELSLLVSTICDLSDACGSRISLPVFLAYREALAIETSNRRSSLDSAESKLGAIREVVRNWNDHNASEPWWMTVLWFLPPVKRRKQYRDKAFLRRYSELLETLGMHMDLRIEEFDLRLARLEENLRSSRADCGSSAEELSKMTEWFEQRLFAYKKWCEEVGIAGEEAEVLSILDTRFRYRLFQLATHYWEACYLLEVESLLAENTDYKDSMAPFNLERHYRRLAKLAPCFISTLHMIPKWFRGYSGEEQYLVGVIDLLVIDEAGQVAPENAAAAFSLAKRTCVLGDEHQIEPVWSVTESIDRKNAARFLDTSSAEAYDGLVKRGCMAASGSVLAMSQPVSPYSTHKEVARGLFLTEHRRCLPGIIAYCNRLVYKGLLEPCRPHETFTHGLPPFGWMHVRGQNNKMFGSQANEVEADVIVEWIIANKEKLEEAYNRPLKKVLAIVTPFTAQSRRIQAALRKKGLSSEKLTVGTLHVMQGAEREIVIFSPTYGTNHQGGMFFDRSPRMLNVAVSRAKDAFLVFGNMDLFRGATGPAGLLGEFLFSDVDNELGGLPKRLPAYASKAGHFEMLSTLEQHRAALRDAFERARERVIVVSPFVTSKALEADDIPRLIRDAAERGVQVIILADVALNRDKVAFQKCVRALESSGAIVLLARKRGIHCKIVCRDNELIIWGSFNWLAAVRHESQYQRLENSFVQTGAEAKKAIATFIDDVSQHIPWPRDKSGRAENA